MRYRSLRPLGGLRPAGSRAAARSEVFEAVGVFPPMLRTSLESVAEQVQPPTGIGLREYDFKQQVPGRRGPALGAIAASSQIGNPPGRLIRAVVPPLFEHGSESAEWSRVALFGNLHRHSGQGSGGCLL